MGRRGDGAPELRYPDGTANHIAVSVEAALPGREPWDPFDQVRIELDRDELAPVQYFEPEFLGLKGWTQAPRVYLVLSTQLPLAVVSEWEAGILRLSGTRTQMVLLRTILDQLAAFERFAMVR